MRCLSFPGSLWLLPLLALPAFADDRPAYPPSPPGPQVDVYHGEEVPDPWRWLEDLDAPATRRWIAAQNRLTQGWLRDVPERRELRRRLEELQDYERYGLPRRKGGRYFFSRNDGLQNQAVLYVAESLDGPARVLLDPNALSEDGTVSLSGASLTEDGRWLAYGLSDAGSDWVTWRIREVDTGRDLPDTLRWVKFSGASWALDGSGFYYGRFPAPDEGEELSDVNRDQAVWFHRRGTPQSEDVLVYSRPDQPDWMTSAEVTDDGRYLVLTVDRPDSVNTAVHVRDLEDPGGGTVELAGDFDARYYVVANQGPLFYVLTDLEAPRYRLLAMDLRQPERAHWREIVPQGRDTLSSVSRVGDRFFAEYLVDARTQVEVLDLEGRPVGRVPLPGIGSAGGFAGRPEDTETFFSFTSYTTPAVIYRYDLPSGSVSVWRKPELRFDPDRYVTRQVFVESRDGTRVPMFLSHRRDLEPDGELPVLLYGYGGFSISLTPGFAVDNLVWMERGGVHAVANLRGGGEYGEEWHQAGTRTRKQNVFDDFVACAEWLIREGWTRPGRLAIEGGSNGGLLVGACLTQRPELFGACVAHVGVMDMLRFPKFTIGYYWISDYGSPEDPEEFRALRRYSPYHNLKSGVRYPATLVLTGDHDDRVFPGHSFKFAAAMQAAQDAADPVLIRVETRAGHGAGKPTTMWLDEQADVLAFLTRVLEVRPQAP